MKIENKKKRNKELGNEIHKLGTSQIQLHLNFVLRGSRLEKAFSKIS